MQLPLKMCVNFQNPSMDLPKDRPMPKDRTTPYAVTPHTQTTDAKKPNLLQVDDLIEMLSNHKENPEKWTLDYIASRFEIPKEQAGKSRTKRMHEHKINSIFLFILINSTEKLVANYSTLETYYADAPSKSDKYLQHDDPVKRIGPNITVFEGEAITGTKIEWKGLDHLKKRWTGKWTEVQWARINENDLSLLWKCFRVTFIVQKLNMNSE